MRHSSMPGAGRIRLSSIEGEKKGIQFSITAEVLWHSFDVSVGVRDWTKAYKVHFCIIPLRHCCLMISLRRLCFKAASISNRMNS